MIIIYSSKHKYNSGTGWPSFYQTAIEGNVATNIDQKYGLTRTEVHCSKVCILLSKIFVINCLYFSAKLI
jgi:peptide-methionine (R)-S-oxide reductase